LRIVIETDIQSGEPPTGVLRREGFGDGTRFSGWIEMLHLLEKALAPTGESLDSGDSGLETTREAVAPRPPAESPGD
jgi:hypothetical protein